MDRIRSAFNGMIKRERYSRFTLQPTENGERHAEVKLSDDATEIETGGSPSFRPAPLHQSRRSVTFLVLGIAVLFLSGFIMGFFSHPKPQAEVVKCPTVPSQVMPAPEAQLDWSAISQLLTEQLTSEAFENTLKKYDMPSRSAGSVEDMSLANRIFNTFKELQMNPWKDTHYVQLPTPVSQHSNRVEFESDLFEPTGYLAYSACGRVQGKLVYGNYGRNEDLDAVQKKNVMLNTSVVLLRAGKITFAEQVDNAASKGAVAVLIYADPKDYNYRTDTQLYGHVHLGSGDPYTPGFPSFNHTQFPPTESSGLPKIPAQTITANMATTLLQKIGGPESDPGFKGNLSLVSYNLGGIKNITVQVNNTLVNKEIHNVFGVIKGFTDPDRYIVLGAQRDAWGRGYTKAAVGTSILMELAEAFRVMVEKKGFRPRRSLVFASWGAGEYGNVGATEWLEAHMASIGQNVYTYISLDGLVMGLGGFIASASPLLYSLLESSMKGVKSPLGSGSVYDMVGEKWETSVLRQMAIDDPAYPFLASSGIPSISFHFIYDQTEYYTYYGTNLDNMDHLNYQTSYGTSKMMVAAAQLAGQMALRMVHDRLLKFDVMRYSSLLTKSVVRVYKHVTELSKSGRLKNVSPQWLNRARGSFMRAANSINDAIINTDLNDEEACRTLNDRLMTIERTLLSPYTSPINTPFRHLLHGRGPHTLESIAVATDDMKDLHIQLALATWNLQGCANAMVGNIWDIDNEI